MVYVILFARLLLVAVFLISGVAKLLDLAGSRRAMSDFGIPIELGVPLSVLLPFAEIAVSLTLLFSGTAWWGAIGAAVLLTMFTMLIIVNLARGRNPDCHCFGQLHAKPIGPSTVIRNLVLACLSALIIWRGPVALESGFTNWPIPISLWQVAGFGLAATVLILLAVQGWFLIHLLRQNGRLLLRIESLESQILAGHGIHPQKVASGTADNVRSNKMGLPVGSVAPMEFWGSDVRGQQVSLKSFWAKDRPSLLLFSDPKCGPCLAMMRSVTAWQRDYARSLNVVVVTQGDREVNRAKAVEYGLRNVLIQEGREIASAYNVLGTPSAVLVLPSGEVGNQTVGGVEAITQLVKDSVANAPDNLAMALSGSKGQGRPGFRYERLDEEAI